MAKEDMSGLSQEQLRSFTKLTNSLKELPDRQLEILEKILNSETEIGKLRLGYLKEYFDLYSRNLDILAHRQSSLSEEYLILEKKSAEAANRQNFSSDSSSGGGGKPPKKPKGSNGADDSSDDNDDAFLAKLEERSKVAKQIVSDENKARLKAENDIAEEVRELSVKESEARMLERAKEAQKLLEDQAKLRLKNREEYYEEITQQRIAAKQGQDAYDKYDERRLARQIQNQKELERQQKLTEEKLLDLYNTRYQTAADREQELAALRLSKLQEAIDMEQRAQDHLNEMLTEIRYGVEAPIGTENGKAVNQAGEHSEQQATNEILNQALKAVDAEADTYKKQLMLAMQKEKERNGESVTLTKADYTEIEKKVADFKADKLGARDENGEITATISDASIKKLVDDQAKKDLQAQEQEKFDKDWDSLKNAKTFTDYKEAIYNLTHDEGGNFDKKESLTAGVKLLDSVVSKLGDMAKQLEADIDAIASFKSSIDTRLQGSSLDRRNGSYWDQMVRDMTSIGAINPFFEQKTFANNIKTLVEAGIAFDVEQRAFLMTIKDKIAATFDVSNGTLLRLIRIQQQDSTAGRLGMESALNAFLNSMYENTEYLKNVADSVRSSLEEMEALMDGAAATEVEYQIQKWLGSLYSVGMSQSAVQSLSDTLGKIAAGQIEGLTNGGAGNLLIMAANDAGLSIADILTDGINASDTNKLLQAAVNYLGELAESSKDNKVVQQQLASVFGVNASDLRAATNLTNSDSMSDIFGTNLAYGNMVSQLLAMAGSMGSRTSLAEMMTNIWKNGQYTIAGGIASSPVSYFIYKMASMLDSTVGGIAIPAISIMGNMVDLETTVADLMRLGAVGGGILSSLGSIVSGIGSSFSGRAMLNKLGITSESGLTALVRGGVNSEPLGAAGGGVSESGTYAGNASGSDVKDSTIQEANDSKKQQMIEAKEEAEANEVTMLNQTAIQIYELLNDVANGDKSFKVEVKGYGLTKAGSSSNSALGGVGGLENLSNTGNGISGNNSGGFGGNGRSASSNNGIGSGGSANGGGLGGSIDLGGWIMT